MVKILSKYALGLAIHKLGLHGPLLVCITVAAAHRWKKSIFVINTFEILRLNDTPWQHFTAQQETLCCYEFIESELFGPANEKHLGCSCLGQALKVRETSQRGLSPSTGSHFSRQFDVWVDPSIVFCVTELHGVFRMLLPAKSNPLWQNLLPCNLLFFQSSSGNSVLQQVLV